MFMKVGVILTKCFWSRCFVSYLYSFVVYLYVNGSGSNTSVGEERANFSAVVCLYLCGFCLERVSSSSGCLGWVTLFYCGTP